MKNLKTLTLSLVILVTFGTAKAAGLNTDNEALTVNHAVNTYVNALTHGQVADLSTVIDASAKFTMLRGAKMLSFTKADLITLVKQDENLEQQCVTTTSVSESNTDLTVVKVDMKYATFTRTNYVTLTNTTDGWKITSVYTVFK
ncbi:nuclear transport factor 2 family protein [Mucilaginibacter sp. AW1-3]